MKIITYKRSIYIPIRVLGLWCLTTLSTIFQFYL